MRGFWVLAFLALPAWAVRVEWLSPRPGTYDEGRVVRLEVRVVPEAKETILSARGIALPSGKEVFFLAGGGTISRYWDTTGYGGTTALRLEVEYAGEGRGVAYATLPLSVRGSPTGQNLQAQGLVDDLDGFIAQACRYIGFYELASVRWLCTAHRTVRKAVNYWNQLGDMWEDFKSQAMYYGTGLALDWLGKGLGLHTLNPIVDQVDQALDSFFSDIRRQKNAILRALAQARARQIQEIENWRPGQDYPYWGPEWWTRIIAGVVPQLGFEASQQSLKDLQRTAQLLENQARLAQNVKDQQENMSLENTLQDLWDNLGAAWNFIKEAVARGWASLTGGLSGQSLEGPAPGGLPQAQASFQPQQTPGGGSGGGGTSGGASGGGPTGADGISEQLVQEAQSAPSSRQVMEVVVKGFAQMLRLEAQNGFRAVQEMKNLATQQAYTVEQLVQVNQNLVELIRKQEESRVDQLRVAMSQVASQAEKTSAKYVAAGEILAELARQWKAQSNGGAP